MKNKLNIISLSETVEENFKKALESSHPFEPKGIFNSEILFFYALVHHFGIGHIIESGRARGQSTEMICRCVNDQNIKFDSIEFARDTEDALVAENRLKDFKNLTLHYGDSFQLLPSISKESSEDKAIIIDGPKGVYALKLGIEALRDSRNKLIFFHDVHLDAQPSRSLLDKYFGNNAMYSDDRSFVKRFSFFDDNCWEILKSNSVIKEAREWGPYVRGKKRMKSYSATLGCIVNEDISQDQIDTALAEIERKIRKRERILSKIVRKIKNTLSLK